MKKRAAAMLSEISSPSQVRRYGGRIRHTQLHQLRPSGGGTWFGKRDVTSPGLHRSERSEHVRKQGSISGVLGGPTRPKLGPPGSWSKKWSPQLNSRSPRIAGCSQNGVFWGADFGVFFSCEACKQLHPRFRHLVFHRQSPGLGAAVAVSWIYKQEKWCCYVDWLSALETLDGAR